ncbi:unnamed protein product [Clavelina lepadiformis]|uniref:Uncharacterized protein n=1 Tax=Clavelina lepadiformis TaxID=159417 RepID=A0ABP0GMP2_CLALP
MTTGFFPDYDYEWAIHSTKPLTKWTNAKHPINVNANGSYLECAAVWSEYPETWHSRERREERERSALEVGRKPEPWRVSSEVFMEYVECVGEPFESVLLGYFKRKSSVRESFEKCSTVQLAQPGSRVFEMSIGNSPTSA